jgi:hypothetical protein
MSSGNLKSDVPFFKNFFEINTPNVSQIQLSESRISKKFYEIQRLSQELNENFISIDLQTFDDKDTILRNLFEIHLLLTFNNELNIKQNFDYCRVQRFYMNKYLKQILEKLL